MNQKNKGWSTSYINERGERDYIDLIKIRDLIKVAKQEPSKSMKLMDDDGDTWEFKLEGK